MVLNKILVFFGGKMSDLTQIKDEVILSIQDIQEDVNAIKESSEQLVSTMESQYLHLLVRLKLTEKKLLELELENIELKEKLNQ